jgi:hypothetical protein
MFSHRIDFYNLLNERFFLIIEVKNEKACRETGRPFLYSGSNELTQDHHLLCGRLSFGANR